MKTNKRYSPIEREPQMGKRESFDLFRYGQQVAAAIWTGMLALLLLFASSGAIDPAKELPFQECC